MTTDLGAQRLRECADVLRDVPRQHGSVGGGGGGGDLQTEVVSQHEVHGPAVTVHQLTVLSQSSPGCLQ